MSAAVATVASAGESRHASLCAAHRRAFRLGTGNLVIDISDDTAADVIDRVYGRMRSDAPRGHAQTALVRRLSDGRLHVRYGRRVISTLHSRAEADQAAYNAAREIFARFAASIDGTMAFYGAALGVGDAGVMIVGPAAIGKTLLALHAAHLGATFLGDETAMLDLRSGEVFAMPRRPALRESALPWLPNDAIAGEVVTSPNVFETERGRFWYALEGVVPSERALKLRAVCIVRDRREVSSVRRLELGAALPLIAQRAYARPSELNQIAALRKALRGVVCLEISLGTPQESATGLLREVSACV
jgi:hypothetical protein